MAKEGQGVPSLLLKTPLFCPSKLGGEGGNKMILVEVLPFVHYTTKQEGGMCLSLLFFAFSSHSIISHSPPLFSNLPYNT